MAQKLQQQLREVGAKIETPPTSKDALIKLLKQAAKYLSELDQSPSPSMLDSMKSCLNAIVKPDLLKHQDRDVKLLVAACICEITRITAPEAPYSDDVLRDIFHLIVGTFSGLNDINSPSFGRRVAILETLARYRSCVVMLDLECDDLVNEMCHTFFAVASDNHPESVLTSMQTIMILLLEESEDIQDSLLIILLSVLGRRKSDVSVAARKLAMNVIEHCAGKLEPFVKQFLISSMSGDNNSLISQFDYHEVIYDIYCCAPQILSGVIPYLTGELLTDQLETRLKAVKLLGDLFALPDCPISEAFQPIFSEFLKRLTDRVVDVRLSVIEHVKSCLLSNPVRVEAPQIVAALSDRLLDYDESVRKQVVAAVCDVACCTLKSIPVETLRVVAERLRDKSLLVKRYTMDRLAEIYKLYCLKASDDSISSTEYEWIPGKILRCFYDKDFRSETIEVVLCASMFPTEFSIKDKVKHWVTVFASFDKVEIKALEKMMEQKQRLQQEMQKYLSLRQMYQDHDAAEFQKKVLLCFRIMSRWFVDPAKAEESFLVLDQLKDANIWKILGNILDPNTSFQQAWVHRDDLLKILGEKHRLYDFLGTLSTKCSFLFSKEHVKEILLEAATQRSAGNTQLTLACMNLLVIIASFSPLLLSGTEEDLVHLLKEDNDLTKEGALQILARAGGTIREGLAATSNSVDLILERLCLEGSRKQAKYAVHALAAITKDDGLKSLSVLYKRLVDMLKERTHLPAILQSLGCIAQTAMPVFETRENEIIEFIKTNILEQSHKTEDKSKANWEERSELCLLKIFGLKTLVKSFLPVKDAHLRVGFENLLKILKNMLLFGDSSRDMDSSHVDKVHMKLASAKAVLRLSKHWDHKISMDVFHLTLGVSEVQYPEARKLFLGKVHQYIKDRLLDVKYACAFLFTANEFQQLDNKEDKHNLVEIIQMCYQARARQLPVQCDGNPLMPYPIYILPFLVHALAHHSSFPNIDECRDNKVYEPIYRKLYLFLYVLIYGEGDVKSEVAISQEKEVLSTIISIFHGIKCSEDVVDAIKSKNSHAICDLGLSIIKRLSQKQEDVTSLTASIPLPSALYKPLEQKGDDCLGNEVHTWLADDSVLAHFESLRLDPNGTVDEDEKVLKDSDADGNEVPLGKMIKHLKSQGIKTKKTGKKKILPAELKNPENDDIVGTVREINLDILERSKDMESGNGHEYFDTEQVDGRINGGMASLPQKRKRKPFGDPTPLTLQKRKRSSLAHKSSYSRSSSKGVKKAFRDYSHNIQIPSIKMHEDHTDSTNELSMDKEMGEPMETDLLASCLPIKKTSSSKLKPKSADYNSSRVEDIAGEFSKPEMKMSTVHAVADTDSPTTKTKSTSASAKKRKRRSIAGLAKCSLKEVENQSLVGCRIKVWWPLDKQFYQGLVQSYDSGKKKHVVLYDDGDVEVLSLNKERWELVTDEENPRKQLDSAKISPSKGISPEEKKNGKRKPSSSQQNKKLIKKPSSKVGCRETPNKSLEIKLHGNLESEEHAEFSEAESRDVSDLSNPDHGAVLMNSGDSEGEQTKQTKKSPGSGDGGGDGSGDEKETENAGVAPTDLDKFKEEGSEKDDGTKEAEKSGTDEELSGEGEKSDSEEWEEEIQKRPNNTLESDKEDDVSDSGMKETQIAVKSPGETEQSNEDEKPDKSSSGAAGNSDDETLSVWKRRAGKGKAA